MSSKLIEIVNFNFVLIDVDLLDTEEYIASFEEKSGVDIRRLNNGRFLDPSVIEIQSSRVLSMERDRIVFTSSKTRSVVQRDFPTIEQIQKDLDRFVDCVVWSFQCTSIDKDEFIWGYNVELVFDQNVCETATQYLGERLFNANFRDDTMFGSNFTGGYGVLKATGTNNDAWTFNFAPNANSHVTTQFLVAVNLTVSDSCLPDTTVLADSIMRIISTVQTVVECVDKWS